MGKSKADMRALTKILTHVNAQTFEANASTLINEVVDTPGYGGDFMLASKKERAACLLLAARVFFDPVDNIIATVASAKFTTQLQQGDHDVDTDMIPMTDQDLLMQASLELHVYADARLPLDLEPIHPDPLIITRQFTIAHRGTATVNLNSRIMYTVLTYQIVAVSTEKYADMLLTQQRTS